MWGVPSRGRLLKSGGETVIVRGWEWGEEEGGCASDGVTHILTSDSRGWPG